MNITILSVGHVKEQYWRDAVSEYSKRISRYASLKIVEVIDEKTPDRCSDNERDVIICKEAERLSKQIRKGTYLISLEIDGRQMDSVSLSGFIDDLQVHGISDITFVIGGSLGLHRSITEISDMHLSFSKMTFPHQMMRVILLEQIYRSFRISRGEPYHK